MSLEIELTTRGDPSCPSIIQLGEACAGIALGLGIAARVVRGYFFLFSSALPSSLNFILVQSLLLI